MKTREVCEFCKKRFGQKSFSKAYLENCDVLLACPACGRTNVLLKCVHCEYSKFRHGGWGFAWEYPNKPVELFSVYSIRETRFKCLCAEHASLEADG